MIGPDQGFGLSGTWVREGRIVLITTGELEGGIGHQFIRRTELTFNTDSTFEEVELILGESDRTMLGFRYIRQGAFTVDGEILSQTLNRVAYVGEPPGYVDILPPLVNMNGARIEQRIEIGRMRLRIIAPPCPPNANCIGDRIFERWIK